MESVLKLGKCCLLSAAFLDDPVYIVRQLFRSRRAGRNLLSRRDVNAELVYENIADLIWTTIFHQRAESRFMIAHGVDSIENIEVKHMVGCKFASNLGGLGGTGNIVDSPVQHSFDYLVFGIKENGT